MKVGSRVCLLLAALLAGCSVPVGLRLEEPILEDGAVTLRWEEFPSAEVLAQDAQGYLKDATGIGYEVILMRGHELQPVVRRSHLRAHELVVHGLQPARYFWTVRPRFRIASGERVGEWSTRYNDERIWVALGQDLAGGIFLPQPFIEQLYQEEGTRVRERFGFPLPLRSMVPSPSQLLATFVIPE